MNRRRAIIGLSVLCALCLSAFAASGASAKGTTAGECSPSAPVKDFEDEHCDRAKSPGGSFGHVLFPLNTTVNVTAVNNLTGTTTSTFTLAGKIAGNLVHLQCTTVAGTGTVKNEEEESGAMKLKFGESTTTFSGCSALDPPAIVPCTVTVAEVKAIETDPMNLKKGASTTDLTGNALAEPVEEGGGSEMGLKFTASGAHFTEIELSGASCPAGFKGKFPVTGSAIATGGRVNGSLESTSSSGATGVFSKASTIKFLKFAGTAATLEGTLTFRKSGGNPLIITTTTT